MSTRRSLAGFLVLAALLALGPVRAPAAETRFSDYAVEWFDPSGRLVATGWLHLVLIPIDSVEVQIYGRYRADRRESGAPPLGPEGVPVRGRMFGHRLELGIRALLFEVVNVEALASEADAPQLEGRWRYSESWSSRSGAWRAYPISAPPPAMLTDAGPLPGWR